MSLRDHLNLSGVTITRSTVTTDDYGDPVTSSATVTLSKAAIWSPGQGDRLISDKIAKTSTHVLAIVSGEYTFTDPDATVAYGGHVYRLVGHPDDVANRGVIVVHGMEQIT